MVTHRIYFFGPNNFILALTTLYTPRLPLCTPRLALAFKWTHAGYSNPTVITTGVGYIVQGFLKL